MASETVVSDVHERPARNVLVGLHEQPARVGDLQEKRSRVVGTSDRRLLLETRRRRTTVLKPTAVQSVLARLKCLPPYEMNPDEDLRQHPASELRQPAYDFNSDA